MLKWPPAFFWPCILGSLFTAVGLFALGLYGFHENQLFEDHSELTEGIVLAKSDDLSVGKYGEIGHRMTLAYSYQVGAGQYQVPSMLVGSRTWLNVKLHGVIPIKYLPQEPSRSRINFPDEERTNALRPWGAVFMGGIILTFGGVVWMTKRNG